MDRNKPDTNSNLSSNASRVEKKLLVPKTEEERLREDIYRSDMEKLHLFTPNAKT